MIFGLGFGLIYGQRDYEVIPLIFTFLPRTESRADGPNFDMKFSQISNTSDQTLYIFVQKLYLPYTEGVGLHVGEDHDQEDVAVVDPGRLGVSRICYCKGPGVKTKINFEQCSYI